MFKLSKREHLESLLHPLRKNNYRFRFREKQVLSDSYVQLTISGKQEFLEIRLIRKWTRIFGKYHIRLSCSGIIILEHLNLANEYAKKHTKPINFLKKNFHKKLNSAIAALREEQTVFFSSKTSTQKFDEKIEGLKTNALYEEKLSIFDFVRPAIGVEMTDTEVHLSFGISFGGDQGGGLVMFDPTEGELELGAYTRVSNIGIYDAIEIELPDSIEDFFD